MTAQEVTVDTLIAKIYAAAHDPAKWQEVVCDLRDYFRTTQACFVRSGPDATAADHIRAKDDPYFDALYLREFANDTTLLAKIFTRLPIGVVFSEHNYIDREQLRRERFWKEWLAPQNMYYPMGCKLYTDGVSTWYVSMDRGEHEEPFTKSDMAELQRLIPHFVNAIRTGLALAASRAPSATLSQVQLGVIVLDAEQRILFANEAAERILADAASPLLRGNAGQLGTSDRAKAPELAAAVTDAIANGTQDDRSMKYFLLHAQHDDEANDLSIAVSPLSSKNDIFAPGRQALLTVRKLSREAPQDFDQQLRMLFGLSAQEARVAAKLAYGATLKQVAERLDISMPTARTHLAGLFRKTRTAQQSQLVALLRASGS